MSYITTTILKKIVSRKRKSHKGDFGKILIIGGSYQYPGAPLLAGLAAESALRSGADYVTVAAPEKVAWNIHTVCPDIITIKVPVDEKKGYFEARHAKQVIKIARKYDVVLLGCGMGRNSDAFIRTVARAITKPKVIDADAIKALSLGEVKNAIFTPHAMEYSALIKNSNIRNMLRLQEDYLGSNVILLKGAQDKIMSREKMLMNKTGNAVMTKAGTGDVLAGLVVGFLAQMVKQKDRKDEKTLSQKLFDAACLGAYVNGKVGDYLLKKKGRTFIASDVVENIEKVWR